MDVATPPHPTTLPARKPPLHAGAPMIWTRVRRVLLCIAAFLSGYHLLRVGEQNLSFSDVAFLGALLILAVQGEMRLTPFGALTPLWLSSLFLMLAALFVSTVVQGDLMRWFTIAIQYLVGWLFIPIVLMSEGKPFLRRLALFYVIGTTAMEAVGIAAVQSMSWQAASGLFGNGFLAGNGRLGSFAGEANWNGAMIAFALPMLVYVVHRRMIPFVLGIGMAAILAWALLLCASFSGFIASSVALAIVFGLLGGRHLLKLLIGVAVVAAGFVGSGAPVPAVFAKRVGGALAAGDVTQAGTFNDRAELIGEAWALSEDGMLVGVGVDRYREISSHGQPVHNLYLLILAEGGFVSLLGLLGMLAILVISALSGLRRQRPEAAMCLATIFVFLVYTVSSPHMFSRLWVFPVMIALATLYGRNAPRMASAHRPDWPRPPSE